jgi:hypothetical protein
MINYSLLYDVSDVKRTLQVERKFILESIYHFSDFFSSNAKPEKGSSSKIFRYGDQIQKDEHFADLNHLKRLMDYAEDAFLKIHRQKPQLAPNIKLSIEAQNTFL